MLLLFNFDFAYDRSVKKKKGMFQDNLYVSLLAVKDMTLPCNWNDCKLLKII